LRCTNEYKVVSGFQLPKTHGKEDKKKGEVIDPYVKVWINGVSTDRRSCKTKTVKNNGFNPVWKTEFKFPLAAPELAIVTFSLADADFVSSDDFIGQNTIAVANIRDGYRYVPLCDKKGNEYEKASLLVHFRWA
jgi:Ca2+-dependent lipid-binding protein